MIIFWSLYTAHTLAGNFKPREVSLKYSWRLNTLTSLHNVMQPPTQIAVSGVCLLGGEREKWGGEEVKGEGEQAVFE